jgi:hypothetical protein
LTRADRRVFYTAKNKRATLIVTWCPYTPFGSKTLAPATFVKIECAACGHDVLIPASAPLQGLRLPPTYRVLDLEPRLRCRECDTREAMVSIRWGEPAA